MVSIEQFKEMAMSFEGTEESPHFEKTSFRIKNKIFASLSEGNNQAVVKFNEIDQSAFSAYDKKTIYPVPGAWGKKGWTIVELKSVKMEQLEDALTTAYCEVAPKKLAEKYRKE